ncbi:MAG: alpha/beta hydrolase [Acidimicrobiaceae bacterium]|nr:alpha/beta hydrolase [Acidimicrobiaceae bacterium]NCG38115.1 alpha/beta fold hydrolase [Actinomycetota bacterium]
MTPGTYMIDVGDVVLSVAISGSGPPLLLTTPGWGVSIHAYQHLRPLQERFTVVWAETRGTGKSSAPDNGDYKLTSFTADAEALRVALGAERWWVAGHSTGGVLAQHYLAHHTDRCLGAILLCTYLPLEPGRFDDVVARATARAGDPRCDRAIEAFSTPVATDDEATKKLGELLPLYFHDVEAADRFMAECDGLSCRVAAMVAEDETNLDRTAVEILPGIDLPVVIVAASNDFVCSAPWNQQIHQLIPGSKFVFIENAGHFPWFEQPGQFWSGLDDALPALQG